MIKNLNFFLLLITLIIIFEGIAQYHIRKSKDNDSDIYYYFLIGVLAYSVVCVLLRKCYDFDGIGMTNFIWSIMSIITIMLIGIIAFNERLTRNDIIGIILAVIGLYFIFMMDHDEEKESLAKSEDISI